MNSANSHFLERVAIWTGQRKVNVVSVVKHLQKRLVATNRARQHLEMLIYHSIHLRIKKQKGDF